MISDVEAAQIQVEAMTTGKGYITNEKAMELVAENMQLKNSVSKFKTMTYMLVGVACLLALSTVSSSVVAIYSSQATTVDDLGHLLSADSGQKVATIGEGQVFDLNMKQSTESGQRYACMPAQDVADLWRSTMNGVTTNAQLLSHDATTGLVQQTGMSLTFDGAVHNDNKSCMNSTNGQHTLCVDFVNTENLCQDGTTPHDRRQLFLDLTSRRRLGICQQYPYLPQCKPGGGGTASTTPLVDTTLLVVVDLSL